MPVRRHWFTLVEVLVVVTILALFWTIAMFAFRGYTVEARNSKRVTDLNSIKTSITTQITNGLNIMGLVTLVYDNQIPISGASLAWVIPTYSINYTAGTLNYTPLNMIAEDFYDPTTIGPYVIWVHTINKWGAYQLAARLEAIDDPINRALILWNFKPRSLTPTTGFINAGNIAGNGGVWQKIFTLLGGIDTNIFKVWDTVSGTPAFTSWTTRKITKISADGKSITLDIPLTNAGSTTLTALSLNAVETQSLIDEGTRTADALVLNGWSALPYEMLACTPTYTTSVLWSTGTKPSAITVDAGGNIYTANFQDATVTKLSPGGVPTTYGPTWSHPMGIVLDNAGNIYTANNGSNSITKITPGGTITTLSSVGTHPNGIVVDNLWNVYVANNGSDSVTKTIPAWVTTTFWTTGNSPTAIVIDAFGNIYTTNAGSDNISKIAPDGTTTIFWWTTAHPVWLTIDIAGNIYTTDNVTDTVTKITQTGVSTTLWNTSAHPNGIVVDVFGNVYTTDNVANTVTKITSLGSSSTLTTVWNTPGGITIDPYGNIYTANYNWGNVSKLAYDCR